MFSFIKTSWYTINISITIYALLSNFWISRFTHFFAPPRGFSPSPRPAEIWSAPLHPWNLVETDCKLNEVTFENSAAGLCLRRYAGGWSLGQPFLPLQLTIYWWKKCFETSQPCLFDNVRNSSLLLQGSDSAGFLLGSLFQGHSYNTIRVWLFKEFWNLPEWREIQDFKQSSNNANNVYLNFILAFSLNRYGYYDGEFPVSDFREINFHKFDQPKRK